MDRLDSAPWGSEEKQGCFANAGAVVMRGPVGARRLTMAVLMALVAMPAAAQAQHSKISLESIGPGGGNGSFAADLVGAPEAGKRVFLSTPEPLTAGDTDSSIDLYSRTGGNTTLLTTGTSGGNGVFPANYGHGIQSTSRLVFQTDEKLVSTDTDSSLDVYERSNGTTTLLSTGPGSGANGAFDAYFAAASSDGSRVFFTTRASLVG